MKVFLAFAFRDADKDLVDYVDRLFASHFVETITGEGLGGDALTPAVQTRIDGCDAVVGLLTQRDAIQNGGFTTHQWVLDEIAYARNKGKRAIAIVESGVNVAGMYQPHEYIPLDRASLLPTFIRLSETVGLWKREMGRTVKVQILPQALAKKFGGSSNGIRCSHRLWSQGRNSAWTEVTPVPEGAGGTFAWIQGVQDEHLIQLRIESGGKAWHSPATSQWMQILLKGGGGK
jgi:hypothetical protein